MLGTLRSAVAEETVEVRLPRPLARAARAVDRAYRARDARRYLRGDKEMLRLDRHLRRCGWSVTAGDDMAVWSFERRPDAAVADRDGWTVVVHDLPVSTVKLRGSYGRPIVVAPADMHVLADVVSGRPVPDEELLRVLGLHPWFAAAVAEHPSASDDVRSFAVLAG